MRLAKRGRRERIQEPLIKFRRPLVDSRSTLFDAPRSSEAAAVIMENVTYGNDAKFARRADISEANLPETEKAEQTREYAVILAFALQCERNRRTYNSR